MSFIISFLLLGPLHLESFNLDEFHLAHGCNRSDSMLILVSLAQHVGIW